MPNDSPPVTPLRGAVVLETDVNGLGAIRSLRSIRPTPPLVIGVDFAKSIGFHTRLCRVIAAPPPHLDDGRPLCDFLLNLANDIGGPLALFPCGDRTVRLVSKYRDALSRFYRTLLAEPGQIESLVNKARFAGLAKCANALTPNDAVVNPAVNAAAAAGLRFPIVAKPLNLDGDDPVKRAFKVRLFNTSGEWDTFFAHWNQGGQVLIQERIEGNDTDICFYGGVWKNGSPICGFTGRKIRQQPKGHGSTVMASCERIDDVKHLAEQFLQNIRFTGLCDVEYKRDRRDGRYYLIEVNPRQGQWHQIGRLCGIDLIQAAYHALSGLNSVWPEQPIGCSGRWSYQFQDVARLVDDWRRGDLSLARWIRPYFSLPRDGVFNWGDPRPWAMEFAEWTLNKLKSRSSREKVITSDLAQAT